jgi:hypothetical protein
MTSYCVSITEQTTGKCNIFVKLRCFPSLVWMAQATVKVFPVNCAVEVTLRYKQEEDLNLIMLYIISM